ncbi:MAG: glycosyltransferase family 2 protein [Pseudomonadota bacterium]
MRISLAIPTRERADLLGPCLDAALAVEDPDFEIVVSDNASQDHTHEMIASRQDPRLKVTRTGARVSMRANFENALAATTGDYVIFIGDDDGVLPSGIAMLRAVLENHEPEAVGWPLLGYTWPSARPGHEAGVLTLRRRDAYGGIRHEPREALLDRLLRAKIRNYKDLPNIYHGCISRRLIGRVLAERGEPYFAGAIPDVYSSIANLLAMRTKMFWVDHPVTFGGASDRSNGVAQCGATKATKEGAAEVEAFVSEGNQDVGAAGIDLTVPSVDALTLDMLEIATHETPHFGRIDQSAWLAKIQRRLARMPRSKAEHGVRFLEHWAEKRGLGAEYEVAKARYPISGPESEPEGSRASVSQTGWHEFSFASSSEMATVADCASVLETVLGPHEPNRAWALRKWIGARSRARALTESWN